MSDSDLDDLKYELDMAYSEGDFETINDLLHLEEDVDEELYWDISYSAQHDTFKQQFMNVHSLLLLSSNATEHIRHSLLVMLHAHLVASFEAYLSSVCIHKVTNSDIYIRRLIETDPEFANKKIALKDIYSESEKLKTTVASYLKDLIFHKLSKVQLMYKSLFGFEFNELCWAYHAIEIRHDCVHRAGYRKDGSKLELTEGSVRILADEINLVVQDIEDHFMSIENKI
tara:strand:+ start:541 stop:1224 length:684 start_codon:yes stop_codon:yes gene_type:complete